MAFTVPNAADAATYPQQARLDSRDFDILTAGFNTTGVESGCAVTAQGSPNMTVAVAAGVVRIGGARVVVAGGNSGTVTAADATNPRIDLVTVNTSGAVVLVTGTAAATPVIPAVPASRVVLARLDVPATGTSITSGQIIDKRVLISPGNTEDVRTYGAVGDARNFTASITTGTATLTSSLATPTGAGATPSTTNGTLAAATYSYRVSAINAYGETLAATGVTATTTGTTSSVAVSWSAVTGATAYKIYGRTAGSELFIAQVSAPVVTWTDNGQLGASGALPGSNTTGPFLPTHVGKAVYVSKAGASSAQYVGTVASYTSATSVTLSANASTTATSVQATVGTDDSTAISSAIAALVNGSTLYFPNGNYLCSGVAINGKSNLTVSGDYATVTCYTEANPVIQIQNGTQVGVQGLRLTHASTSARNGSGYGIQTKYVQDLLVQGNFITQVTAAGIFIDNVVRATVLANTVYNNLADGIHITKGATDIDVVGNRLVNVGDDAIAFVSYLSDGVQCSRFTATGNSIFQGAARGISCVGSTNGSIVGNVINGTTAANIYVAQESGSFNTYGCTDITVEGNTCINSTAYGTVTTTQAAIHLSNSTANLVVDRVSIVGNHIYSPAYSFVSVDGVSTGVTDITIANNDCYGPSSVASQPGILIGGNANFVNCHSNHIYKATLHGIQSYATTAWIHDNMIVSPNQTSSAGTWGIQRPGGTALIWNNVVVPDSGKTALSGNVSAAPTAAAGAGAGTSPPAPVVVSNSNDQNGTITFGSGTSPAIGVMVTVTFASPYPVIPKVALCPGNLATAIKSVYIGTVSTTTFQIGFGVAATASQANTIYNVGYTVEAQ